MVTITGKLAQFDTNSVTPGDVFCFIQEEELYRVIRVFDGNTIECVDFKDAIKKDGEWCRDYTKTAYFYTCNSNRTIINYGNVKGDKLRRLMSNEKKKR